MPLNTKGKKIMKSMKKQYGKKRGKQVFYATLNKKKIITDFCKERLNKFFIFLFLIEFFQ